MNTSIEDIANQNCLMQQHKMNVNLKYIWGWRILRRGGMED